MDTITLNKASRLYWLGRYTERVYTGLKRIRKITDEMIDGKEADFVGYCRRLGIPSGYQNTEQFCHKYIFDTSDFNSLASSLVFAYDNAIVLRETLTTETLSYILLALGEMDKGQDSDAPGLNIQAVLDDILAFRGSCEETIFDESVRNLIRLGISIERVDLYLRLGEKKEKIRSEFERLFNRLYKTQLTPDKENLDILVDALLDSSKPDLSDYALIGALEGLFIGL